MWENNGRLWKLWPFFAASFGFFCWYYLLAIFVAFCFFSMVLNSGRLSGAFFRLFKPFFHEKGVTINTQGNCVLF